MKELTIQAEQLYRWRERLKQGTPSEESDIVIKQIESLLKDIGVTDLEKRYFVITNPTGNVAGDYGWIVFYHPVFGKILNGMISVCEEFAHGDSDESMAVPLSDLTEITKEQYEKIGDCLIKGEDPSDVIADILTAKKMDEKLKGIFTIQDELNGDDSIKPSESMTGIKERVLALKYEYGLSDIEFIGVLSTVITDLTKIHQ